MLTIHADSHLDHNLTPSHVAFLRRHFADRTGFFIETVILPHELSDLTCGLYGPTMGDPPVTEDVSFAARGNRPYPTRAVIAPMRPTRFMTVIAGPYKDAPCVLYTAHGGPMAPREVGDPTLLTEEARAESAAFWAVHALAVA